MTIINKKSNPKELEKLPSIVNIGAPFIGEEHNGKYLFVNRISLNDGEWVTCHKSPENYMILMGATSKLKLMQATSSEMYKMANRNNPWTKNIQK